MKEFGSDPVQAFPGHGQMKPQQQEIDRLLHEVVKSTAKREILKRPQLSRGGSDMNYCKLAPKPYAQMSEFPQIVCDHSMRP